MNVASFPSALMVMLITCLFSKSVAHENSSPDSVKNFSAYKRSYSIGALFIGQYAYSLTKGVDPNGLHHIEGNTVSNTFNIKYMRVSGKFQINDKLDMGLLVNLADFKGDTKGKVLENAFIRYKFNEFATFQFGQFRPYFGVEDLYGVELHKSNIWSNQYNAFGKSNWMSFQMGAALTGSLHSLDVPLKYFFTVYNGNARNAEMDNDDSKTTAFRMEAEPLKNVIIGADISRAVYHSKTALAHTFDVQVNNKTGSNTYLDIEASYAYGHNLNDFASSKALIEDLDDYRMKGFYLLPRFRYTFNAPRVRAAEFSFRYENFIYNLEKSRNPRNTYTPMVSLILADNYAAKLSLLGVIDRYKQQVSGTTKHNQNHLVAQFQVKF